MPARKKTTSPPDFEQSLNELEQLVEEFEKGELTLEDSLNKFERGIELTRTCQQALKMAQQKVDILMQKDGKSELQPITQDQNNNAQD